MPKEFYTITPPRELSHKALVALVVELNMRLESIGRELTKLSGGDGLTPEFDNTINMKGNSIQNVGKIGYTVTPFANAQNAGVLSAIEGADYGITPPADAPASADILRDDLVANVLPDIESSLNELKTASIAIVRTLRSAGLVS